MKILIMCFRVPFLPLLFTSYHVKEKSKAAKQKQDIDGAGKRGRTGRP